jgi:hypothetical protein
MELHRDGEVTILKLEYAVQQNVSVQYKKPALLAVHFLLEEMLVPFTADPRNGAIKL